MAWLNATPKPPEESRRAKTERKISQLTRLERYSRDKVTPPMPPNPAPDLIKRLIEIGLTEANGMGASPLSWREIMAWQEVTGVRLPPWEARLYRTLSTAYLAEGRRAESENCPAPWHSAPTQRELDLERKRVEAFFE